MIADWFDKGRLNGSYFARIAFLDVKEQRPHLTGLGLI